MYEKRIALMQRRRLKPVARVGSPQEQVKPSRLRLKLLHATRRSPMQQITITFRDDDTLPDRIALMAQAHQTTTQDIIERALSEYLGDFGLKPVPEGFRPKNILELAQAIGVIKPPKT